MGELFFKALACMAAALIAWLIMEPTLPNSVADPTWPIREGRMILVVAACIGLSIGLFTGWQQGSRFHKIRGAVVGLLLGAIGGTFGYQIGGGIVTAIFGSGSITTLPLPLAIIARVIALTPMGLMLGMAAAGTMLLPRRIVAGGVGGMLGAATGAVVFDVIGMAGGGISSLFRGGGDEVGTIPRAIYFGALGAGIGLFTGLLDRATRSAWLRLVLGRNEGKEWPIDAPTTLLGRDERATIPLFGDPNVAAHHATIVRQQGQYLLVDAGAPIGIGLNGQRVGQAVLTSGDTIQIGTHTLQFFLRSGRAQRVIGPERYVPAPHPTVPGGAVAPPVGWSSPPSPATVAMPPVGSPTVAMPSPTGSARFVLIATAGPLTGQRFEVSSPMDLGREAPGIPMGFDQMASRRHASLRPEPSGLHVTDLGSTNGVFVNGQRVPSATLRAGDALTIGSSTFRVELG